MASSESSGSGQKKGKESYLSKWRNDPANYDVWYAAAFSEEARAKSKGKHLAWLAKPGSREILAKGAKNHVCTEEERANRSKAHKGKKKSPEHLKRLQEGHALWRERFKQEHGYDWNVKIHKGRKQTEAWKEVKVAKLRGTKRSPEFCADQSKRLRETFAAAGAADSHSEYSYMFTRYIRKQIRTRDGHTCCLCGKTRKDNSRALPVHHIDYNKANDDEMNLITLCDACHVTTNVLSTRAFYSQFLRDFLIVTYRLVA